ncbi:MAG TPA: hypothetical protein DCE78_06275 [Bacteroidetes bacterium]|nr:hypothetical protein [Bacteroidota bacterium]
MHFSWHSDWHHFIVIFIYKVTDEFLYPFTELNLKNM